MEINDTEVYELEELNDIYPNMPHYKLGGCIALAASGYYFFANSSHAMDTQRRWEDWDLIKVMRSHVNKPSILWAVREPEVKKVEKVSEAYVPVP